MQSFAHRIQMQGRVSDFLNESILQAERFLMENAKLEVLQR